MVLRSRFGNAEGCRDLLVRLPATKQREHLELPARERRAVADTPVEVARRRIARPTLRQNHSADIDHGGFRREIVVDSRLDAHRDEIVVGSEGDDLDPIVDASQGSDHGNAVRHPKIHQEHVGARIARSMGRLVGVCGNTDDRDSRIRAQRSAEPVTIGTNVRNDERSNWSQPVPAVPDCEPGS